MINCKIDEPFQTLGADHSERENLQSTSAFRYWLRSVVFDGRLLTDLID